MKGMIRTISVVSETKEKRSTLHKLLAYVFDLDLPLKRYLTLSLRTVDGYGLLNSDIVADNYRREWIVVAASHDKRDFTITSRKPITYEIDANLIANSITDIALICSTYAEGGK